MVKGFALSAVPPYPCHSGGNYLAGWQVRSYLTAELGPDQFNHLTI